MKKSFALGALALAGAVFTAWGAISLDFPPSVSSNGSGGFTWDYTAQLDSHETVVTGSFFTIYDFGNVLPGSATTQPAGWTPSFSLLGANPAGTNVHDDPNILNITWTYTGTAPIVGASPETLLGTFGIVAATNQSHDGDYASQATTTGPGSIDAHIGNTDVPVPEMSALLPIVSVCTAGLLAMLPGFLRRRA